MDKPDRRSVLRGMAGFAVLGTVACFPSLYTSRFGEGAAPRSKGGEGLASIRYVFASDHRAKETGYRVMPG